MSKFFRKSKKTFAVLLTIAFVLSMVAVPAFAATTYSSLLAPTVPDKADQKLGVVAIKVDPVLASETEHEALVEVEDGWDINEVTVVGLIQEPAGLLVGATIAGQAVVVGDPIPVDDDNFVLEVETAGTGKLEVHLEFTSVDVDDTGNIRAYFTGLKGQLVDGDALIGRGAAGELAVTVREYDNFSDQGNVTLRIVEDTRGTFDPGDDFTLRLPRGFVWNENMTLVENVVFGDVFIDSGPDFSLDKRSVTFTFDSNPDLRSAIDLILGDGTEFAILVDDPARAAKGDVMAEIRGDYDLSTDSEIRVGVYGDYEYEVTPRAAETVYAGRVEQAIADITFAEDIPGTFVMDRTVTMKLPDWAKWGELEADRAHNGAELTLSNFYGRDGREAVYRVTDISTDDPAAIRLRDMEIVLAPSAPVGEDVVVTIAGSAGVRGEVVVGVVEAPATMEMADAIEIIGIGRTAQAVGEIIITEAEAGMFKEDKTINLMLDTDVTWAAGTRVEVLEGDIELGTMTGVGGRTLNIPVEFVSDDEPAVIKVTGTVTTMRTVPEGNTWVRLRGDAVVETLDFDALEGQWGLDVGGWYQIDGKDVVRANNVWPDQANAVVSVLAYVGVPAPPVEEPEPAVVMMWIGSTAYTVDGVQGMMDVAPFIENDRTFVPVRFIAEALGAEADWGPEDGLTEWVTLTRGDMVVTLTIGSNVITVTDGDETYTIMSDVAAQIVNDRTFLPARAVGEIFGATFDWGPKDAMTEWVSFTL